MTSFLVSALNSVDLPTLGSPTIPMVRLTGVQPTWPPPRVPELRLGGGSARLSGPSGASRCDEPPQTGRRPRRSGVGGQEQERREQHQVDDALQSRGPARDDG